MGFNNKTYKQLTQAPFGLDNEHAGLIQEYEQLIEEHRGQDILLERLIRDIRALFQQINVLRQQQRMLMEMGAANGENHE